LRFRIPSKSGASQSVDSRVIWGNEREGFRGAGPISNLSALACGALAWIGSPKLEVGPVFGFDALPLRQPVNRPARVWPIYWL